MAVLRGARGVFVSFGLCVELTQGSDCIDQPLPVNPGVKDGTSARSIPVAISGRFGFNETV